MSPLLLLAQTINSNDSEAPIVPCGSLIDLGNYRDFVHLHETERDLFFGFRYHTHPVEESPKPVGAYPPGGVEMTFRAGGEAQEISLQKYEVTDIFNRTFFTRTAGKNSFLLGGGLKTNGMNAREKAAIRSDFPVNFLFSPTQILYEMDKHGLRDKLESSPNFTEGFAQYLKATGFTFSYIRNILHDLSYVGPLRAKLQRFYRLSGEMPETVGSQGEHVANLFRRKATALKPKIDSWVKAFEFGDELRYEKINDDLFQLKFVSGSEATNIADAGFGASQVLPLIIQAVAAPEDSLTLAEQPEIHLNPRLQCVLADLFVEMANSGHRVVVETHSEHLIVRLRRLIAEGKIEAQDVNLYFIEKIGGHSNIRKIDIDARGSIANDQWPSGFFDETLREALALAAAQSRRPRSASKKVIAKK